MPQVSTKTKKRAGRPRAFDKAAYDRIRSTIERFNKRVNQDVQEGRDQIRQAATYLRGGRTSSAHSQLSENIAMSSFAGAVLRGYSSGGPRDCGKFLATSER